MVDEQSLKFIGIGLLAFGMMGAAIGVGNIFAAAVNGIARNPEAEKKIFKNAIIGAGLAEAMGLFAIVLCFLLLFLK
jgi:F-type H+-transporting ATPase subunit c